jgi:hypothetical protein
MYDYQTVRYSDRKSYIRPTGVWKHRVQEYIWTLDG